MTVGQALKKHPKLETELLLAHVLKKPKEFLFMNPGKKLSGYQVQKLSSLVKRRQKGEPIAYILGCKEFMGLKFKVNKSTLIPRPETEWVVEKIKNSKPKIQGRPIKILDVGTGSGAIIISLAKFLGSRGYSFYASDISAPALRVARQNAQKHGVKIFFAKSDLLENFQGNFDIIVANLPYGWGAWKNNSSAQTTGLKFEPKSALFAQEGGLSEIRRLLEAVAKLPKPPKSVYLEFDPRQKKALSNLAKKNLPKYRQIFHKDYSNFWRYLELAG